MSKSENSRSEERQPQWPRAAVSAAVFRDGRVLIAQRSKPPLKGIWSLPGGHIEPGEKVRAAIERELAEETGIEADLEGIVDVADVILRHDDGSLRAQFVITVFYGVWRRGEACAGSDCLAVDWADPAALSKQPLTEGTVEIIERAARLLDGPASVS